MTKTYESVIADLNAKIPADKVQTREGGGSSKLAYLPGWYVIDRLNRVVGQGNWSYDSNVTLLHQGTVTNKYGKTVHTMHYSARVLLVVEFPDGKKASFVDYGYGDGSDNSNPGKAHELAIKEAVTDGLKRCAKNLGMSMGLALYDKEQENVGDAEDEETTPEPTPARATAKPQPASRETVNKAIQSLSRIAIDKKLRTKEDIQATLRNKYGVDKSAALSDNQAEEFKKELETIVNA